MQSRIGAVLLACVVALVGAAGPSALAAGAEDTIRIGGGFALTGAESSLDVSAYEGATLAVEAINAAGGVDGRMLELIVRDSQYDMTVTAETATGLLEEDHVQAMIGYTDSDSVLAAAPAFQAAGIPFITVGATSPRLPDQVGDMLFLAAFGDNVQAAAGAEFALEQFGDAAYLLWDDGQVYTTLLSGYFKERFTEGGGTIVAEGTYPSDAADFSSQIETILGLSSPPDFVYLAAMPGNVGLAVQQMRAAGIDVPIVGGDGYDTPDLLTVAGDAANGVYFTTHALMDAQRGSDAVKAFMAAYEARFGHPAADAFAALGYDTVNLLADAITRAGSMDGQTLKAAIEATTEFPAITGSISYAPDMHVPLKSVTVIAVEGGTFTLAEQVVPSSVPKP